MTDRELLELAAKAAGLDVGRYDGAAGLNQPYTNFWWNPLNDDGDALRLAVRLQMDVFVRAKFSEAVAPMGTPQSVLHGFSGREAATRSAIVRVAAEIGKAM